MMSISYYEKTFYASFRCYNPLVSFSDSAFVPIARYSMEGKPMLSNEASTYYFRPKNNNSEVECMLSLLVESDKYEANFNSFGFSFGPCYQFVIGSVNIGR